MKFIRKENKLDRIDCYKYFLDGSHEKTWSLFISYGDKRMHLKCVDVDKTHSQVRYQITYNLDNSGKIESCAASRSGEKYEGSIIRNEEMLPIESTNCLFMYLVYLEGSPLFPAMSLNLEYGKFLYEYEMDTHKNWVKKVVYKNDKNTVMHILKRPIEYYD